MGVVAEPHRADLAVQAIQSELIDGLSATHRELIAFSLDLPRKSSSRQIVAVFKQDRRIRKIFEELSDSARRLLIKATFKASGVALELGRYDLEFEFRSQERSLIASAELERWGLVFAFRASGDVFYRIPEDLQLRLRSVLVAPFARTVSSARAYRWLAAPRQDLHDIASVWSDIARARVPLSLNGEIWKKSKPRLLAALPVLNLPDSDEVLTEHRLHLALTQLRDAGYLRAVELKHGHYATRAKLLATGHIADALRDDGMFERPPSGQYYRHRDVTVCVLALGDALRERSVGLASFVTAFDALLNDSGCSSHRDSTLTVLLPFWLRGEVQFGLNARGELVAIRFKRCPEADRSLARLLLAEFYDQFPLANPSGSEGHQELSVEEELESYGSLSQSRMRWSPREQIHPLEHELGLTSETDLSKITQISTLDGAPTDPYRLIRGRLREGTRVAEAEPIALGS